MTKMRFDIVTAERLVFSEEIDILVAPGYLGELSVLPNHAPLLTTLKPGEVRMVNGTNETYIAVSGGFLEVTTGKVTILADTAERAEEIDFDRAEEALRRAQERVTSHKTDMDLERALSSVKRSQTRLMVARRRQKRGHKNEPGLPVP